MATSTNFSRSATGQLTADLSEAWVRYRSALATRWDLYKAYRRSIYELSNLTDRELADLGMFRTDIADISHRAVYGDAQA